MSMRKSSANASLSRVSIRALPGSGAGCGRDARALLPSRDDGNPPRDGGPLRHDDDGIPRDAENKRSWLTVKIIKTVIAAAVGAIAILIYL